MERERLLQVAETERQRHQDEAMRLQEVIDVLMTSMEWHLAQRDQWSSYMASLAIKGTPPPEPTDRHLHLVPGDAS